MRDVQVESKQGPEKIEFVLSNMGDWAGGMGPRKSGRNGRIGRKRRSDFAEAAAVGPKNAQGPKKSAFLDYFYNILLDRAV